MRKNKKITKWCEEEDKMIATLVDEIGLQSWTNIAKQLGKNGYRNKTGKQCRERWYNSLSPDISKNSWTSEENEILFEKHRLLGNQWTSIAEFLPGRTDNSVKNYFYSTIRKGFRRMSKLLGSKNSTIKIRKIKPSTISKIFCLAEGRVSENSTPGMQDLKLEGLRENCAEFLHYLIEFSKSKSKSVNEKDIGLQETDFQTFSTLMEKMQQINQIYENEKINTAHEKRQRKLQKNYDQVALSSDDQDQPHEDLDQPFQHDHPLFTRDKIFITRNNRKVKQPVLYQPELTRPKRKDTPASEEEIMSESENNSVEESEESSEYNVEEAVMFGEEINQREQEIMNLEESGGHSSLFNILGSPKGNPSQDPQSLMVSFNNQLSDAYATSLNSRENQKQQSSYREQI